jgi:hypothetical protein
MSSKGEEQIMNSFRWIVVVFIVCNAGYLYADSENEVMDYVKEGKYVLSAKMKGIDKEENKEVSLEKQGWNIIVSKEGEKEVMKGVVDKKKRVKIIMNIQSTKISYIGKVNKKVNFQGIGMLKQTASSLWKANGI